MTTLASSPFSVELPELLNSHLEHLKASAISTEIIRERGYRSILGKKHLADLGFSQAQQRTPGILIPLWGTDGKQVGHQYRPDNPRLTSKAKPIKYENPVASSIRLDCPPCCHRLLADPSIPLWITEGCKKADALASKGACAISLTGVWGFKGKNELGGITFLADWDYIALKNRTVYLAFDSDVTTKPPVHQALARLAEHLSRKGAHILTISLPQEGQEKTAIDDYLLDHSLEEAQALAQELAPSDEPRETTLSVPGFVSPDGAIGEMVVTEDGDRHFIIAINGSVRKATEYKTSKTTYTPTKDPLVGQVVHFAATAQPYDSQVSLFQEIKTFIHRYLELPEDFEDISALYVLLTWVYEFAPSVPYLRVIGDWGSGKTRFLQVVGSICFRPIFASGATTPSPIFRILDKFRGTLVLDEADFKDSSAWVDIVKILNNGYRPGFPVLRADKDDGKWHPQAFQVFGPKLIATRAPFKDEALESRCLTAEMMPLTRQDIPRVLPPSFETEVQDLRSKLLTFRFANLLKLKGMTFGNDLLEPDLQPRLQEILIPLKVMLNGDQSMSETLCHFIHHQQDTLFSRRRESSAGRVLAAMIELQGEGEQLSSTNIAAKIKEMDEEAPLLNAEKVGWLTRKLGFEKQRLHGGRRVTRWDEPRIARLILLYGLSLNPSISQEKPSQPSLLSPLALESGDSLCGSQKPSPYEPLSDGDGCDSSGSISEDKETTEIDDWDELEKELDAFLKEHEEGADDG